ncbi:hypothetical protein [Enterobacter ludwigii]|uniref:hypothetical protein n=1 Tax=Enterobacter ludwigii TaxID=299767 RepID=UPI0032AF2228
MRKVVAFVRGFPEQKMDGVLTAGFKATRHTPVGNDQLVILHSQLSKSFFDDKAYMQVFDFSLDGADFIDFYLLASDDKGYIFQSNP